MKKIFTCLLTILGLTTACAQQHHEDTDVKGFSELIEDPNTVVLDVRTANEFEEGHIDGALNIDQSQDDFVQKAKAALPTDKTIAIYCRSGRRSVSAAEKLAAEGYRVLNLKGGIIAWEEAGMHTTTDTYEMDVFKTKSGKTVKIHALIHSSIRIEYDSKEILIDPVMKLGNTAINYSAIPKADYILVTHEHHDHFDKEAIKQLTDDTTQLVTNQQCADILGYGQVMTNGQCLTLGDMTIEAVPAYNTSNARTQFHPKGRDNGFILTLDGFRIYIAGDTEDIPEMENIKDIDIAFLPCNQPYTMTAEQLVKAAKVIRPKVLFPYHYGQTDISTIPLQLKEDGIDVRIRHYE